MRIFKEKPQIEQTLPLRESVEKAIESIKTGEYKGTYLKVELEAQLDRDYDSDGGEGYYDTCSECEGSGTVTCDECDGDWQDEHFATVCDYCHEGTSTCHVCDGSGERYYEDEDGYGEHSDDWCWEVILAHVSEACKQNTVFSKFYYDGSVDSEFNFTVPLSWEGLGYAIEYVHAFKALAREIGGGLDVSGAGMHMTILRSRNGEYPYQNPVLHRTKWRNFSKAMNRLMPALYLLASEDHKSRGLNYRAPGCGIGTHANAVDISSQTVRLGGIGAVIEWRVFETCYNRPEMMYDFICTIAKGLEFYSSEAKPIEITRIGKLEFVDSYSQQGLHKYFMTEKHLDLLDKGLKYLKPDHRTLAEVKRLRNFTVTPKTIKKKHDRLTRQVEDDYDKHMKERDWLLAERIANVVDQHEFDRLHPRIMSYDDDYGVTEYEIITPADDKEDAGVLGEKIENTIRNFRREYPSGKKRFIDKKIKEALYQGNRYTLRA